MNKQNNIDIIIISSEEFLPYTTTMLCSMFENVEKGYTFNIHVLTDGISENKKNKLSNFCRKYNSEIEFVTPSKEQLSTFDGIIVSKHVINLTYAKVILADIFEKLDRAIFLDCDLIVRGDISELWKLDLKDNWYAIVKDVSSHIHAPRIFGDGTDKTYYNTGVMLMDLLQIRTADFKERVSEAIAKNKRIYKIGEQDIISDAFNDKILPISEKWNLYYHEYFDIIKPFYEPTDKDNYEELYENPKIFHFVGPRKPWFPFVQHPYKKEFYHYFKKTPFYKSYNSGTTELLGTNHSFKYIGNFQLYHKQINAVEKSFSVFGINLGKIPTKGSFLHKFETYFINNLSNDGKLYRTLRAIYRPAYNFFSNICSLFTTPPQRHTQFKKLQTLEEQNKKTLNAIQQQQNQNQQILQEIKIAESKMSNLVAVIQAQTVNREAFAEYRNAFAGKDVVLVATGPSASKYVPIEGAIHVGVNGACRFEGLNLDFLFIQDNTSNQKGNESLNHDVDKYNPESCKKFYGVIGQELLSCQRNILRILPSSYNHKNVKPYILEDGIVNNKPNLMDSKIAFDLAFEPMGNLYGTPFSALQFIFYTSPKRIYLVGCDCSSGYFYDTEKKNYLDVSQQMPSWKLIKDFAVKYHSTIEIVSINPVGLKGLFIDKFEE